MRFACILSVLQFAEHDAFLAGLDVGRLNLGRIALGNDKVDGALILAEHRVLERFIRRKSMLSFPAQAPAFGA